VDAGNVIELIGPTLGVVVAVMAWGLVRTHLNKQRIGQLEGQMEGLTALQTQFASLCSEMRARFINDTEAFKRNYQDHDDIKKEQQITRDELKETRQELLREIRHINGCNKEGE
jgi:hypothetical protein